MSISFFEMAREEAYKDAVDDVDFKYLNELSKKVSKRRFKYLTGVFEKLSEVINCENDEELLICDESILKPKLDESIRII